MPLAMNRTTRKTSDGWQAPTTGTSGWRSRNDSNNLNPESGSGRSMVISAISGRRARFDRRAESAGDEVMVTSFPSTPRYTEISSVSVSLSQTARILITNVSFFQVPSRIQTLMRVDRTGLAVDGQQP